MIMNSPFLHCMWSDRRSRLSLTRACGIFSLSLGWSFARACCVWTSGPILDPYWLICEALLTVAHLWLFVDHW